MKIQDVRVTVGRTWRFASDARGCVDVNTSAYRRQLDQLKGAPGAGGFSLPWPNYPSHLWQYMLAPDYRAVATPRLVAALLPLRWAKTPVLQGNVEDPQQVGADPAFEVTAEALRHPFAITTLVHVRRLSDGPLPDDLNAAYEALRFMMQLTLGFPTALGAGPRVVVRNGLPLAVLPGLPRASFEGEALTWETLGEFTLISGLHRELDGLATASALARELGDEPQPDDAVKLRSHKSGISVSGRTVGVTLNADYPRATQKMGCLHHNYSLLLAYMSSLSATLSGEVTASADWFRRRAGMQLNSLYRRTPLDPFETIYKSRAPELWIREQRLAEKINRATAAEQVDPIPID